MNDAGLTERTADPGPYLQRAGVHDEMVDRDGRLRPLWQPFADAYRALTPAQRGQIQADARRNLDEVGLSYNAFADAIFYGSSHLSKFLL